MSLDFGTEHGSKAENSNKEKTYEPPDGNNITPAVRVVNEKLCYCALDYVTSRNSSVYDVWQKKISGSCRRMFQ